MNPHLKLAYEHGVRTALYEAGITKYAEETPAWMRAGPLAGGLTAAALLSPRVRRLAGNALSKLTPVTGVSMKELRGAAPQIMKGVGVIGAGTTLGWLPQLTYEGIKAGT